MEFLGLYTEEYEREFLRPQLRVVLNRFGRYQRYDCDKLCPPAESDVLGIIYKRLGMALLVA